MTLVEKPGAFPDVLHGLIRLFPVRANNPTRLLNIGARASSAFTEPHGAAGVAEDSCDSSLVPFHLKPSFFFFIHSKQTAPGPNLKRFILSSIYCVLVRLLNTLNLPKENHFK